MVDGKTQHKNPSPPDQITLNDELIKHIFYNMNCVQIGIIQSFDKTNQTATVQIALKRVLSEDLGIYQQYPLCVDVPCFILSGGIGSIEFPISQGDECILLFNDREIDNWFVSGEISIPDGKRSHALSDSIALVGIKSLVKSIADYITNGSRWKYGTTSIILYDLLVAVSKKMEINGTIKPTGYLSSDGSVGITTTQTIEIGGNVTKTMTIKNGLITGIS